MKELTYNKSLIDELAREVGKLRNAVNGGVLNTYFGYFAFSRGIFAQANASATSGVLYELLSTDDIRHAQRIVSLLSAPNENWVNNEITRRRNIVINATANFSQAEAIVFVDLVENQIRDLGQWTDDLISKLQ